MKDYFYIVTVTCETQGQADKVIVERISPEEDYGFEYGIDWQFSHKDVRLIDDGDNCPTCGKDLLWDKSERIYYCVDDWRHG